jgi:hypothetical protein
MTRGEKCKRLDLLGMNRVKTLDFSGDPAIAFRTTQARAYVLMGTPNIVLKI